jgi:hypothetical protein
MDRRAALAGHAAAADWSVAGVDAQPAEELDLDD